MHHFCRTGPESIIFACHSPPRKRLEFFPSLVIQIRKNYNDGPSIPPPLTEGPFNDMQTLPGPSSCHLSEKISTPTNTYLVSMDSPRYTGFNYMKYSHLSFNLGTSSPHFKHFLSHISLVFRRCPHAGTVEILIYIAA